MRCPLTRARICALMYPTSVPTYSTEIGTSCSVTETTLTTGGGGPAAAPDFRLQPASVEVTTTASRTAAKNALVFIVFAPISGREDIAGSPVGQSRLAIRRHRRTRIQSLHTLAFR